MLTKKIYRLVFLFACAFNVLFANAQVKLSVIPSKTTVRPDETLELEFIATGIKSADEFKLPVFRNFEQTEITQKSTGATWIKGVLTDYISYTVTLRPKLSGKLPIASALVKVNGKLYTSDPFEITVTEKDPQQEREEKPDNYLLPGENVKTKIAGNLFIRTIVNKKTCFAGEPVLATFKLFTRLNSESNILKMPSLNGFSVIDLDNNENNNFSKEKINGKIFNSYVIRKVQLYPLLPGEMIIEPVEVGNVVYLIKVDNDLSQKGGSSWLQAMMQKMKEAESRRENRIVDTVVLKTPELTLKVEELPQQNKPENFNGAVGQFEMKTELLQNSIAANENAVLRITIDGSGNLPMITQPVVKWPSGVDSFSATTKEDLIKSTVPVSGSKIFDIPFSVEKEGAFTIPSVSFSYFNPETKAYRSIVSKPLHLNVTKAVKQKSYLKNAETKKTVPGWIFAGSSFLIVAAGLLFFIKRKPKQKEIVSAPATENAVPKKSIADFLQPSIHIMGTVHDKQFYTLLLDAVQLYFYDRLHLSTIHINNSIIEQTLRQKQNDGLAAKYQQFKYDCELAIFSGVEINHSKDQLLETALTLMQEAEKKIG